MGQIEDNAQVFSKLLEDPNRNLFQKANKKKEEHIFVTFLHFFETEREISYFTFH